MTGKYTGRTTIGPVGGGTLALMSAGSVFARARALAPYHLDAVLGVLVGIEMQAEAALVDVAGGERVALHAALAVLAAGPVLRRRFPVPARVAALAAFVVVQDRKSVVQGKS